MKQRWIFVDFFRFCAVFLMLQGHVFDAFLSPDYKIGIWWDIHKFIHGFTAPIFLFSSGLAFGVVTFQRWERYLTWGDSLVKRIKRYGFLFFMGYLIHIPFLSATYLMNRVPSDGQYTNLIKVDALQVIALTLIVCQLLVYLLKDRAKFVKVLWYCIYVIALITPFTWYWQPDFMHEVLLGYFNRTTGSIFPVFPWSMYLFAGIITASHWYDALKNQTVAVLIPKMLKTGFLIWGIAYALVNVFSTEVLTYFFPPQSSSSTLNYLVEHSYALKILLLQINYIGAIMVLVVGLYKLDQYFTQKRGENPYGKVLKNVIILGQETLFIYISHLMVVYGSALNKPFLYKLREKLDIPEAILYFVGLFVVTIVVTRWWHYLKKEQPFYFNLVRYAIIAFCVFHFVTDGWLIDFNKLF